MKLMKLAGAAAVGALALTTGLAGVASADPADDVAILIGNLPAAIDEVTQGVQGAIDAYTDTNSFVLANAALKQELIEAIDALVEGTEQFGALGGFGSTILVNGIGGIYEPILAALDDPSLADQIIDGDDITQLLNNLAPAISEGLHPFGTNTGLACALAETLRGNFTDGEFASTGTLGCGVSGFAAFYIKLMENVDNASLQSTFGPVLVILIAGPTAANGHLQTLEDSLAPVFEALAPVTGAIADAIDGLPPIG